MKDGRDRARTFPSIHPSIRPFHPSCSHFIAFFSFSQTVNIFRALSVPFETVNVLEDDALRNGMKQYSGWPTFPQVYLGGELVGGADIAIQLFQSGELAEMVEAAFAE